MNWEDAEAWAKGSNVDKQSDRIEPNWSWDCGFKLDFDGALVHVSSRFYPMKLQDSSVVFDGSVSFYVNDDEIFNQEFSLRCLDSLKNKVESYVVSVANNIKILLENNPGVFVETKNVNRD